jgi:outer membrane immunogenic protein
MALTERGAMRHSGRNDMRVLRETATALAVAAAVLTATAAAADDRGGPGYYAEPYPSSWTGAYAGVHAGFGEGGAVGGGQIGYNWQSGRIVYGVEADFSLSSIGDDASGCIDGVGCAFASTDLDWLATVRGRVGYLIGPGILAYATAGFGIASWSAEVGATIPGMASARARFDGTETDFVFGFGVEGKISETMTARLELLAFDDFDVDIIRAALNFKLGQ